MGTVALVVALLTSIVVGFWVVSLVARLVTSRRERQREEVVPAVYEREAAWAREAARIRELEFARKVDKVGEAVAAALGKRPIISQELEAHLVGLVGEIRGRLSLLSMDSYRTFVRQEVEDFVAEEPGLFAGKDSSAAFQRWTTRWTMRCEALGLRLTRDAQVALRHYADRELQRNMRATAGA